jgi:hypothetical protein
MEKGEKDGGGRRERERVTRLRVVGKVRRRGDEN